MKEWKAWGLLLLLLGLTASAIAGNLSGNVSGILRFEDSPYSVVGPITVPTDSQLVVEPGVDLRFAQGAALIVRGQLIVMGTSSQRVIFQGGDGQTWNGIRFENGLPLVSTLTHVEIRGTSNPIAADRSNVVIDSSQLYGTNKGLFITRSTVLLSNSLLSMTISQLEPGFGVYAVESDVQVLRDTILVNSYGVCDEVAGISVQLGTATISSNIIQVYSASAFSTSGIYLYSQDDAYIGRNIVKVTSLLFSCGLRLENSGAGVHAYHNSIHQMSLNNTSYGLMIQDGRAVQIRNNVVLGNNYGYGIGSSDVNVVNADYSLVYGFTVPFYNVPPNIHDIIAHPQLGNNFEPLAGSPVIDSGDPSLPNDPDGSICDIGAIPFYHVSSPEPGAALPANVSLAAWPNPFNARVSFALPATGNVSWRIVDRLGRTITSGAAVAEKEFHASWQPSNTASGWYILEVASSKGVARRNLCYLR